MGNALILFGLNGSFKRMVLFCCHTNIMFKVMQTAEMSLARSVNEVERSCKLMFILLLYLYNQRDHPLLAEWDDEYFWKKDKRVKKFTV